MLFVLVWCWTDEESESISTWEVLTWWEYLEGLSGEIDTQLETFDQDNSDITGEVFSWNEQDQTVGEVIEETVAKQSWFWVEECNRIIDFNLCVISKAPVENQPSMKESLQKAIESWTLMANAQLREVCQDAVSRESFKEVVEHYANLEDGCAY